MKFRGSRNQRVLDVQKSLENIRESYGYWGVKLFAKGKNSEGKAVFHKTNVIKGFDYELSGYSLRQKDGFKKNKQETLSGLRKVGTLTYVHTILRLDDFMVLDNKDGLFSCYLVSEDWVINKIKAEKEEETKKAEEEKTRAEEEKIRVENEKKAAEEQQNNAKRDTNDVRFK